jgi:hypothetical protein
MADVVRAAEQLVADAGADDADTGGVLLVEVVEEAAASPSDISGETTRMRGALSLRAMTSTIVRPGAWSARWSCHGGTGWVWSSTLSTPPMATMASFMPFSMPLMIADMPTNEATPRMMPSIVSIERNLCAQISFRPTAMVLKRFISRSGAPG